MVQYGSDKRHIRKTLTPKQLFLKSKHSLNTPKIWTFIDIIKITSELTTSLFLKLFLNICTHEQSHFRLSLAKWGCVCPCTRTVSRLYLLTRFFACCSRRDMTCAAYLVFSSFLLQVHITWWSRSEQFLFPVAGSHRVMITFWVIRVSCCRYASRNDHILSNSCFFLQVHITWWSHSE